jgi:prevent-host-death family protein
MKVVSRVSVSELKRDLSEIVNRAAYGKDRIVVMSRGKPKAAVIGMEDLRLLESLGQEEVRRIRRMAALEAARAVRSETSAWAGGPLPDSTEELRALREERTDERDGLR